MVPEKPFQVLVRLQVTGHSFQGFFKGNYNLYGAGCVPMHKAGML